MNCQDCQKLLDEYHEGTLSPFLKTKVDVHLETCTTCRQIHFAVIVAEKVIRYEKELVADPFMVTRLMAGISQSERKSPGSTIFLSRILRPAVLTVSLAAATFSGIFIGGLMPAATEVRKIPVELALINDTGLESIDILSKE